MKLFRFKSRNYMGYILCNSYKECYSLILDKLNDIRISIVDEPNPYYKRVLEKRLTKHKNYAMLVYTKLK